MVVNDMANADVLSAKNKYISPVDIIVYIFLCKNGNKIETIGTSLNIFTGNKK